MENSRKIKREILILLERKAFLAKDKDVAVQALNLAKQALIKGKGGDVFAIQEAQSSYNALNSTILSIDSQIENRKHELEKVTLIEKEEIALAQIVELDANMESVANLHGKKLAELDAHISRYASEILSLRSEASQIQKDFRIAVQQLIPKVNKLSYAHLPDVEKDVENLFEKLRAKGAKLEALRADRVFNEFQSVLSDSGAYSPPQLENVEVIILSLKAASRR
jgi:ribosome-associated translation inhibitor RaiA